MDGMPETRTVRNGETLVLLGAALCLVMGTGGLAAAGKRQARLDAIWDSQRYIKVSEIKPGMPAYCLTDYGENGIEKFEMKVLDVVFGIRDVEPGRSLILVMGMDERFKHTGPVAGCSGSPVYIDGRLAGALAWVYTLSKDPLYGATPIEEMLEVGEVEGAGALGGSSRSASLAFDLSKPIDLAEIDKQLTARKVPASSSPTGPVALPCPLLISGLPGETCRQLTAPLEAMGFMAVASPGGTVSMKEGETALKPGGTLAIPMVTGDIKMSAVGTVTEIRGDRVYGFGHSLFGGGATNLPMAGGKVYTVVSNLSYSFKMATCSDIVGAITCDQSGAVVGRIGEKPRMIPLTIHCERFDALEPCNYNCQVAYHQERTASYVRAAILAAGYRGGSFPPNHTVEYDAAIDFDDGRSIHFANTSANSELVEPGIEIAGSLALLMNNPFRMAEIKGLRFDVRVLPKNIASYFWSVEVANPKIKPGDTIETEVVIESFLKQKKKYQVSLEVPDNLPAGKYSLMFLGYREYELFLRKSVPYKFLVTNYQTLVDYLNNVLNVNRTKLYCLLILPPSGIALERAELPGLPGTKTLILQSDRRAMSIQPYPRWVEKIVETGTVITDKPEMVPITVHKD
jgi:hypothetical protein